MTRDADTLHRIEAALRLLYDGDDAALWLRTPQVLLDGRVPAELIRDGRAKEVLAVLEAATTGAYV